MLKNFLGKKIKKTYKKVLTKSNINPNILKMKTPLPYPMIKKKEEIKRNMLKYNQEYFFQNFEEFSTLQPFDDNLLLSNMVLGHLLTDNKRSFTDSILTDKVFKHNLKLKILSSMSLVFEKISYEVVDYYKKELENCKNNFKGFKFIRKNIAKYLENKNNIETSWQNIYMLNGSNKCFKFILEYILQNSNDSVMISKPYDPKLKNMITLNGGNESFYELDQNYNFKFCFENLVKNFDKNIEEGKNIKAIFISNPNFPTGSVLEKKDVENILNFAYDKKLILIINRDVPEVFFRKDKEEVNFYEILNDMEEEKKKNSIKIVFYESLSNGYLFSSGLRSAFMELRNFEKHEIKKLEKNMENYIPNKYGQICFDFLIKEFDPNLRLLSFEKDYNQLKEIRTGVSDFFKDFEYRMKSVNSILNYDKKNEEKLLNSYFPEGGYCFFPKIIFPKKFLEICKKKNKLPDNYYCEKMMEEIGISVIPGNIFGITDEYRIMFFVIDINANLFIENFEKIKFFNKRFFYEIEKENVN